jgi:hypothetical protein
MHLHMSISRQDQYYVLISIDNVHYEAKVL